MYQSSEAMLFGSNAVGLSLPTSDVDIFLYNLPCYTREEASDILAHLAIQINALSWIVSCSAYLTAKVPVIKLEVDPSVNYFETKRKCDSYSMFQYPNIIPYLELKNPNKEGRHPRIIKVDVTASWDEEKNIGSQAT
jgi:hypothetical protein